MESHYLPGTGSGTYWRANFISPLFSASRATGAVWTMKERQQDIWKDTNYLPSLLVLIYRHICPISGLRIILECHGLKLPSPSKLNSCFFFYLGPILCILQKLTRYPEDTSRSLDSKIVENLKGFLGDGRGALGCFGFY